MKVILLGTGAPPPDPERMSASLLVSGEGRSFLVDCGRNVAVQLARAGVDLTQIADLCITHHHYDHICGLDDFAITSYGQGRRATLQVYGPPGTRTIVDLLFGQVYQTDLLSRQLAVPTRPPFRWAVTEVAEGLVYKDETWTIEAAMVDHWRTAFPQLEALSLAYRFTQGGRSVVFSGDTIPDAALVKLSRGADVLIHNCFGTAADFARYREQGTVLWNLHTYSSQVGQVASQAGVPRLVPTHFRPPCDRAKLAQMEAEIRRDYDGEIIMGHDLLEIEV